MSENESKSDVRLDLDELDSVTGGVRGRRKYERKRHIGLKMTKELRERMRETSVSRASGNDNGLAE